MRQGILSGVGFGNEVQHIGVPLWRSLFRDLRVGPSQQLLASLVLQGSSLSCLILSHVDVCHGSVCRNAGMRISEPE